MAPTRLFTFEDLLNIATEDDDYELIKGELVRTVPPDLQHGVLQMKLGGILLQYVAEKSLGTVV